MQKNSHILVKEPNWKKNRLGSYQSIPGDIQSWIYEKKSLTQRLKKHYGQTFAVNVVYQDWAKPYLSESMQLYESNRHYCLVREVVLLAGETPLIMARTIIPRSTLQGSQRILSRLGNRPLGEVIFSYPKLQRLALDVAQLDSSHQCQVPENFTDQPDQVWGRRTLYSISGRHLLVCEFFLPGLFKTS
ncbi:MAG: chorismate lyase [Methylococcaceae bacterium]